MCHYNGKLWLMGELSTLTDNILYILYKRFYLQLSHIYTKVCQHVEMDIQTSM